MAKKPRRLGGGGAWVGTGGGGEDIEGAGAGIDGVTGLLAAFLGAVFGFAAALRFAGAFALVAGLAAWGLAAAAFVVLDALGFGMVAPAAPAVFATGFDALGFAGAFGLVAALGAAFVAAGLELAEAAFGAAFGLAVVFFGVVAIVIPLSGGHHFKRITDRFVAVIALWRPINETAAR